MSYEHKFKKRMSEKTKQTEQIILSLKIMAGVHT